MSNRSLAGLTDSLPLLQRMVEIRETEEAIHQLFLKNLIRGTTHLCVGQEACSVGVAAALQPGDTVTCTYRGHGHALALGVTPRSLLAEMMGKVSGCCRGKGGSMHLTDATVGLLGANAIVGAQLPIAAGAALTYQTLRLPYVAVTFFGDGAANIGTFHETLNLAAVWKLPIVFICENNLYGEYSPLATTTPLTDLANRADAYGISGIIADGQDVHAVRTVTADALAWARAGHGPTLIELKTYRFKGHSRSDPATYRTPGELDRWLRRDPLILLRDQLIANHELTPAAYDDLVTSTRARLAADTLWAQAEPYPAADELSQHIFAEN